jgi:hypothetical protein
MGLVEEITAARLPEPTRRKMIRLAGDASLEDFRAELKRRGVDVSHVTIMRWENGTAVPRRDRAIVYRQLLDELEAATR